MFENTRLPMTKWFAAIYLMTTDKGELSAERLCKMIGGCWRSAQRMLDKLRAAMADRDCNYLLTECVEVDDCLVGGQTRQGIRGRNSEGKRPVLVAVSVRADGFRGLSILGVTHRLEARSTPPEVVETWLPMVHRVISNLKRS